MLDLLMKGNHQRAVGKQTCAVVQIGVREKNLLICYLLGDGSP